MRVTYIHHSCFLAETEKSYYLFDYFQGSLPALKPEKPIVVLASHSHHDHYNPAVFSILERMGMQQVLPVLSSDIPPETRPAGLSSQVVSPGERFALPQGQTLTAYRSTDLGVAFLIQDGDDLFYHAGDLNDWVWEGEPEEDNRRMTQAYRQEIDRLAQGLQGKPLSAAFVVLDPRQEEHCHRGLLYFLQHVPCKNVYPMHNWEHPEIIAQFLSEYPQYNALIASADGNTIQEDCL